MSKFAEFLVHFRPPIGISEGFCEGIHEIVPEGFVNFKHSTIDFIIKVDQLFFFPGVHFWSIHVGKCCYNSGVWSFHGVIVFVDHPPELKGH